MLKKQQIFCLAEAAVFLDIAPGDFAAFVRAGQDLPECTDADDLCAVRFTRTGLKLWRLKHTFGMARV